MKQGEGEEVVQNNSASRVKGRFKGRFKENIRQGRGMLITINKNNNK